MIKVNGGLEFTAEETGAHAYCNSLHQNEKLKIRILRYVLACDWKLRWRYQNKVETKDLKTMQEKPKREKDNERFKAFSYKIYPNSHIFLILYPFLLLLSVSPICPIFSHNLLFCIQKSLFHFQWYYHFIRFWYPRITHPSLFTCYSWLWDLWSTVGLAVSLWLICEDFWTHPSGRSNYWSFSEFWGFFCVIFSATP